LIDHRRTAATPFRTIEVSDPRYEPSGLRHVTVKSVALRARADITLFNPPEVKPRGEPNPPLVILLHGAYGSHWAWTLRGGVHVTALSLIRQGTIMPMVLAMPSDGLWGDGSGYVRHAGQDFERWIVEEVAAATALALDRAEPWPAVFLAGLSMGGFAALRLGAKYHRIFHGVSAHSSMTRFEQMREVVEEDLSLYGPPAEARDVLPVILEHRADVPPLRFDCGTEDPLVEHNRELHRQLTAAQVSHRYEEFRGGHEWPYWEDHVADTLRFFHEIVHGSGT
jgi:putative tributyrin esterase